jgi:hypothetical protein
MAFPSSPYDGQQYTQNGFIYQYFASLTLWKKVGTVSSSSNTANVNTLTANTANVNNLSAEFAYITSLFANGSIGTAGQILISNGTSIYWANATGFGFVGSLGYTGSIGSQGDLGYTGSTGSQGDQGYTGSIGSQGNQGYTGSTGSQGVSGYDGSVGFVGSKGDQGIKGDTGDFGGAAFNYLYSTNTTHTSTPDGYFNFDNTNLSLVSALYIDYIDHLGANVYPFLQTIDDSTSAIKGHFSIREIANNLNYAMFAITGSHTEETDHFNVPVSYLNGVTSFVNGTNTIITFARTGNIGDTGYTGSKGNLGYTGSIGSVATTDKLVNGSYELTLDNNGVVNVPISAYSSGQVFAPLYYSLYLGTSSRFVQIDGGDGTVKPNYDGQADLGTSGLKWKDFYLSGTAYINKISANNSLGSAGQVLTSNGSNIYWSTSIGFTGSAGSSGYTGSKGDTGSQGDLGYTGSIGNQGNQGYTGSTGSQGDLGYTGSVGNTGYTGSIGSQGNQGFTGSTGSQGDLGYTGSTGSQGNQGNQGYTGSTGSQGDLGYTGSIGSQGNQGYTGSIGSQGGLGYTGSIGVGYTGSFGSTGYAGSLGFVGSKGDQGTQGYTGSAAEFAGGYVGSVTSSSVTSNTGVIDLLTSQSVTVVQGISVGNNTVNTSITSSQIFSGNTTANAFVTSSSIYVTNSISNSTITSQIIFVGNTTANASFNLIGGTQTHNASRLSVNANGVVTIQTASNHNLYGAGSIVGTLGSFINFDRAWLNNPRILIANTPTPNTISYTLGTFAQTNAFKINAVKRVNGLMTYETFAPHNLLLNDVINVTGTTSSIDSGRFNVTGGVVNTTPTSNTFTVYDSVRSNKTVISSNTVTVSTNPVPFGTAAYVYLTIDVGFPHGIKISELVNISNVTGKYGGATVLSSNPSVLNTRVFNLNGTWTVGTVTQNTFGIYVLNKPTNSAAVLGGSNTLTYTGTFRATVNNDISNTKITTAAYSSLPIISNIPIANGIITYNSPIYINVGNTVSATKITPTSIFVGDLIGNSVVIDSAGTRYKKTGSILQTTVDGSGFAVTSVLDDGGSVVPDAAAFVANTSVIYLGNTTNSTVITQDAVTSSNVFVGLEGTRVSITNETITIEDNTSFTNTTITNSLASFPNDLYVGATLYVNAISDATGSLGADNQVLVSNNSSVYWVDSPVGYTGSAGVGYTGSAGTDGFTGSTGAGFTGSQGTQGNSGFTGSIGAIGYTGSSAASGSSVTISATAPSSPTAGDMWWNSNIGSLYIYYNDGNTSQWVEASPGGAGVSSAFTLGKTIAMSIVFGG